MEVTAGLVFRQGKILITQRFPDSHLGGLWEFPGGKREPGESLVECLARELREELDIEVEVGEKVDSIVHAYPERTVHLHFFRCRWRAREPKALGCPAFRWVSRDELPRHDFPAADARLLDLLTQRTDLWEEA